MVPLRQRPGVVQRGPASSAVLWADLLDKGAGQRSGGWQQAVALGAASRAVAWGRGGKAPARQPVEAASALRWQTPRLLAGWVLTTACCGCCRAALAPAR